MSKRRQFVLDERTNALLEELAGHGARDVSSVLCEAIQLYADMESRHDTIERDPEFRLMMERSDDDIRAGRWVPHNEARRRSRYKRHNG